MIAVDHDVWADPGSKDLPFVYQRVREIFSIGTLCLVRNVKGQPVR